MGRTKISEILGWYGAVAIVGAYFLVSFNVIAADSLLYQMLNFTGAIGVVAVLAKGVQQPAVLNVFWALIALIAIVRILI
jgi:hypothetical protein